VNGRRGFALIAALFLLVVLSAVGLDAALRSQTRRLAAANVLDQTRARAAALAGTEYARSRLTAAMLGKAQELRAEALANARSSRSRRSAERSSIGNLFRGADPLEDPWREPEELMALEMVFGDARFSLRDRDTGAALNLNEASEQSLRQFFSEGLGVDYAEADRITQAILDWRDEDDLPRINGGEREQYLDERRAVLPTDTDFNDLDELRHVAGMTPELYARARPYLTLIGSGDVNLNAAPEPVLLAIPGITPAAVAELLRLREGGRLPRSDRELRSMVSGASADAIENAGRSFSRSTTYGTEEVEILAVGSVDGGPVRVTSRVVVRRGSTEAIVSWRRIE